MEINILDWIQSMRTPIGDVVIPIITKLGDAGMIWILLSVVLLFNPRTRKSGAILAAAALMFAGEKKSWIPALVLAVFIAFSRLYLYVHYPTDILGGVAVGIFAGYAGYWIVKQLWKKKKVVIVEKRRYRNAHPYGKEG